MPPSQIPPGAPFPPHNKNQQQLVHFLGSNFLAVNPCHGGVPFIDNFPSQKKKPIFGGIHKNMIPTQIQMNQLFRE